ncbi:enoyl-CoA hydratase [Nocardioides insulae]|uniref:enoyl-CoA hydratase n=1 Tax=Nocardioides insulae TaxID=394734 RepID=UPI0004060E99|nr:enoyl-CoA hydratase [Nocardioides insulae]
MTTTANGLARSFEDGVLELRLDRPESMNAVNKPLFVELRDALRSVADDTSIRAVTITGSGRGFCAGADLKASGSGEGVSVTVANEVIRAIRETPVPVISLVNGAAAGVGCSLAVACDLVLMARSSYLMLAFTKIGLMPDGGATALIAASAGRHVAMRMALLAEKLPAEKALEHGLASFVYDDDQLLAEGKALATRLAQGAATSFEITKQAINDATLFELENALQRESDGQGQLGLTPDFKEGVEAFVGRRAPVFNGRQPR